MANLHPGSVNVSVAGLESVQDSWLLRVGVLPGPEADGGDLCTGVEFEVGRHCISAASNKVIADG